MILPGWFDSIILPNPLANKWNSNNFLVYETNCPSALAGTWGGGGGVGGCYCFSLFSLSFHPIPTNFLKYINFVK